MTRTKRFFLSLVVAGSTSLVSLPADAFFGMMGAMFGGWGWGWRLGLGWRLGWLGLSRLWLWLGGYPGYGYGWGGYPGYGGWGYPGYGYGWGGYPYVGYPVLTAPVVASPPTTSAEK